MPANLTEAPLEHATPCSKQGNAGVEISSVADPGQQLVTSQSTSRIQDLLSQLIQAYREDVAEKTCLLEENMRLKALLDVHGGNAWRKHMLHNHTTQASTEGMAGMIKLGGTSDVKMSMDHDGIRPDEEPVASTGRVRFDKVPSQCSPAPSDLGAVVSPVVEGVAHASSLLSEWNVTVKSFWTNVPEAFNPNYDIKEAERSGAPPDLTRALTLAEIQELDAEVDDGGADPRSKACRKMLIDPGCTKRMVWDVLGMMLIGYDLVTIPMMAFNETEGAFTTSMGWLTLVFWTSDMVAAVMTGYYLDGKIVMDFKKICIQYLKTWFVVDCIVVVPDWAMKIIGGDGKAAKAGGVLRAFRAVRILRLLRLLKLRKLIVMIYDYIDSEYIFILVSLAKLIFILIFLNHLVACAWYGIGDYTRTTGDYANNWLQDVGKTPVYGESLPWKYFTSLHWSITQFTPASMDIYATNLLERIFSVLILFWALVCLSSFIGSVSASVTQLRSLGADESKQFWLLRRYLKQKKVPKQTKDRILKYLEFKADAARHLVNPSKIQMLDHLSDGLKFELASALNAPILTCHPLFDYLAWNMKTMLLRTCHAAVRIQSFAALDVVFYPEHEALKMFIVKSGLFSYLRRGAQTDMPIQAKMWVCEATLWIKWIHCGHLSAAASAGDLASIDPETFANIMRLHPKPYYFAMQYAEAFAGSIRDCNENDLSDYVDDHLAPSLAEAEHRGRQSCAIALKDRREGDEGDEGDGTVDGMSTQDVQSDERVMPI